MTDIKLIARTASKSIDKKAVQTRIFVIFFQSIPIHFEQCTRPASNPRGFRSLNDSSSQCITKIVLHETSNFETINWSLTWFGSICGHEQMCQVVVAKREKGLLGAGAQRRHQLAVSSYEILTPKVDRHVGGRFFTRQKVAPPRTPVGAPRKERGVCSVGDDFRHFCLQELHRLVMKALGKHHAATTLRENVHGNGFVRFEFYMVLENVQEI